MNPPFMSRKKTYTWRGIGSFFPSDIFQLVDLFSGALLGGLSVAWCTFTRSFAQKRDALWASLFLSQGLQFEPTTSCVSTLSPRKRADRRRRRPRSGRPPWVRIPSAVHLRENRFSFLFYLKECLKNCISLRLCVVVIILLFYYNLCRKRLIDVYLLIITTLSSFYGGNSNDSLGALFVFILWSYWFLFSF